MSKPCKRPIKLNDIPYRKTKSFTEEEKQVIIEYYKTHTMYETCLEYKVRSNAVKMWTDPKYVQKQREAAMRYKQNWTPEQKAKREQYRKERYQGRKEIEKEYQREYNKKNADMLREKRRAYNEKLKADPERYEKHKEQRRARENNLAKTSLTFVINAKMRAWVKRVMQNTSYKKRMQSKDYVGCDFDTFKQHIESKFAEGMSWENFGEWHYDHIIPVSIVDTDRYTGQDLCEKQCKFLNNYLNLQPMWAIENNEKNDFVTLNGQRVKTCFNRNQIHEHIENKFGKPYYECTHEELMKELQLI